MRRSAKVQIRPPRFTYLRCDKMPELPFPIASKLPQVGTTIFSVMSALAQESGAINLSQGFPDFPVPEQLVKRVAHYMKRGFNQYAPMPGVPALREAVAALLAEHGGAAYDFNDEITITAGATQAIFTAIAAVVKEGDEVLLFTPAYDCYAPAVELVGGRPVYLQLHAPDFRVDWEEVKRRVNRHTRMVIINTPHNPTGTVLSRNDLLHLERILSGTETLVMSDEVYEHIVFDGVQHTSAAALPGLRERAFVIGSFGKTYHATGWKTGYVAGPAALMAEFRKVHQYNVFTANTPIQHALADFITGNDHHRTLGAFYQAKRDRFNDGLKDTAFGIAPAAGTYFQLLDYSGITNDLDEGVARDWTTEHGVASIPVSVFYHQPIYEYVLRFCFAKSDETLDAAIDRLRRIA